jgi:hypothetical protein
VLSQIISFSNIRKIKQIMETLCCKAILIQDILILHPLGLGQTKSAKTEKTIFGTNYLMKTSKLILLPPRRAGANKISKDRKNRIQNKFYIEN